MFGQHESLTVRKLINDPSVQQLSTVLTLSREISVEKPKMLLSQSIACAGKLNEIPLKPKLRMKEDRDGKWAVDQLRIMSDKMK
jgi:hypothetical protein